MAKRVLVVPDGNFLAHTSRPFEVSKALRARGFEVEIAGGGKYMALFEKAGFPIRKLETRSPADLLDILRTGRLNFFDDALVKACHAEEKALLEKVRPDVVLTDFRLSMSTTCELLDIPLASLMNAAWTKYYNVKHRAPEHLGVTRLLGESITTVLVPFVKKILVTHDIRPFTRLRARLGLAARPTIFDLMEGDLNLLTDIPEYGPCHGLAPSFEYVGPIVWEPDLPRPAWLDTLDPNRVTLYFTMGSTGNPQIFAEAAKLFGGNSRYQCIVTTGGMTCEMTFPENFFVTDFAPGKQILERTDAVICHGGNGTVYQAMTMGVPIVGIPTMHDQEFNMQRVEALGVGLQLSELRFRREDLAEAIDKVLHTPSFKRNAMHYSIVLAQYDGPREAASHIESLLAKGTHVRQSSQSAARFDKRLVNSLRMIGPSLLG